MGAGLVTPLKSMVLAWLIVPPPAKSLSATNGVTAGPPELICTGVPPGEFTFKVTLAECDKLPLAPVIVIAEDATGVELEVAMVRVDDPDPLIEGGLKLAVAPAGTPPALRATVPVNP